MKLKKIAEIIEKEFPLSDAYDWDNCGLLIGDENRDIKTVLLALDVTEDAVLQAKKAGAELILSHHPLIFGGVKRITSESSEGRIITGLIRNNISAYAAHTNCDRGKNGINAYLAELFELEGAEPLEEDGLGRYGDLKKELCFSELCELTKDKLKTPFLRVCGKEWAKIGRLAVASGACSESIPTAIRKGCDAIITGDIKYHQMLDYENGEICIIDAGHYPTEAVVTEIFEKLLSGYGLTLVKAESSDVFRLV